MDSHRRCRVCAFHVKRDVAFSASTFRGMCLAGVLFSDSSVRWASSVCIGAQAPAIALIAYLNIRSTRFCEACGMTTVEAMPFARAAFCSKCGAPLSIEGDGAIR